MPSYHVEKSIIINAGHEKIMASIKDFREWPSWSPWLIMEPGCKLDYTGTQGETGSAYSWDGDLVGAGSMKLDKLSENNIDMSLGFLRPFKSKAKVSFQLKPLEGGHQVIWHMWGKLPFFLFFMTKMMKAWIGMDYERGLKMLKSQLETGHVHSSLSISGYEDLAKQYYVGLRHTRKLNELGPVMTEDYTQLTALFKQQGIEIEGVPFSITHKLDMVTSNTDFTSALPVSKPVNVRAPFFCGELPAQRTWVIKHTGAYDLLGNAWAMAIMSSRHNKVRLRKKPMGIERYINDPCETAAEDLISEVALLVK